MGSICSMSWQYGSFQISPVTVGSRSTATVCDSSLLAAVPIRLNPCLANSQQALPTRHTNWDAFIPDEPCRCLSYHQGHRSQWDCLPSFLKHIFAGIFGSHFFFVSFNPFCIIPSPPGWRRILMQNWPLMRTYQEHVGAELSFSRCLQDVEAPSLIDVLYLSQPFVRFETGS